MPADAHPTGRSVESGADRVDSLRYISRLVLIYNSAAESHSISSPARLTDRHVQDNSLPFTKPHALHLSCALTVAIGLRKLTAENRRSSMTV
jgi:hypothetical protein